MTIEEYDFKAEQISEGSLFWDLNLIKTKRKRDGTITQEFGDTIYGMPLDSVIKRIIANRVSMKHKDEALTMKQYLDEWKKEMEKLDSLNLKDNEETYEEG